MTKGEGSFHLSSCYKGWRELYAEREANDPSIHITSCRGRNKSTLCHPESCDFFGSLRQRRLGAPFKPGFGLSGITLLFLCHSFIH
jgi:hypothetical protein